MDQRKKSGWLGGGLWFIPVLTFIGAAIFGVQAYIAHNSNSTTQLPTGQVIDNTGNVPYFEIGQFWFAAVLLLCTVVILWLMRNDK